jgi:PhzF family phenazine biosynthesis protein
MGVFDIAIDFAKAAKPTIIQAQRGIQGMIYRLRSLQISTSVYSFRFQGINIRCISISTLIYNVYMAIPKDEYMKRVQYQLVNVFATEALFSGNPLAVFADASSISETEMAALGQQMNLSEITFVLPCAEADAHVRIFTPSYEMPFAGHPTLGTAFVLANGRTSLLLKMKAGIIPVDCDGEHITLTANPPSYRNGPDVNSLSAALGITAEQIIGTPRFVNCGSEQLIVPLDNAASVAQCSLNFALFEQVATNLEGRSGALVWARQRNDDGSETIIARYFWSQNGQAAEDFGTGSTCANLGGWLLAENTPTPFKLTMEQGHGINRIARLYLSINASGEIQVGGKVKKIGGGYFDLSAI